jgi:DNA repair photolyase
MEVGITVTTADDAVRQLFEPHASPIKERIKALGEIHSASISTYAMIAPMLPGAEKLAAQFRGKVEYVLIDRMNYHYGDWVYKKHRLETAMRDEFFTQKGRQLASAFETEKIDCRLLC